MKIRDPSLVGKHLDPSMSVAELVYEMHETTDENGENDAYRRVILPCGCRLHIIITNANTAEKLTPIADELLERMEKGEH